MKKLYLSLEKFRHVSNKSFRINKNSASTPFIYNDIPNIQGGLTNVYNTEIVQNLVHHEPQCLYTYVSAGVL